MMFLDTVSPEEVHYGDCTGADYEMFSMCKAFGIYMVCHPPDNPRLRMFTNPDTGLLLAPRPYLIRNMDIVDATDYLVACPREPVEQPRGGTWMTVRYARGLGRTVVLILPDGEVDIRRTGVVS